MAGQLSVDDDEAVALLAEGVDRNTSLICWRAAAPVALLAEGVDRNSRAVRLLMGRLVALLAEGVDRNQLSRKSFRISGASPSSRRAWIEISFLQNKGRARWVALLAEGVDRNMEHSIKAIHEKEVALLAEGVDRNYPYWFAWVEFAVSPSSRRAWIEISEAAGCCRTP